MTLTQADLRRMLELAERATPGPWTPSHLQVSVGLGVVGYANQVSIGDGRVTISHQSVRTAKRIEREDIGHGLVRETAVPLEKPEHPVTCPDAEHIAACDPSTVASLIRRLIAAEALLDSIEGLLPSSGESAMVRAWREARGQQC